jgi:hypothetical protein
MKNNYLKDIKMPKKYIISVLIPAILIQLCGCYSMRELSKDEITDLKEGGDLIIYTKDSNIYSFKDSDYHISSDSLYGKGYIKFNKDSDFKVEIEKSIALANIAAIQRDEINSSGTTWLIIGSILFAALVGLVIAWAAAMSEI